MSHTNDSSLESYLGCIWWDFQIISIALKRISRSSVFHQTQPSYTWEDFGPNWSKVGQNWYKIGPNWSGLVQIGTKS